MNIISITVMLGYLALIITTIMTNARKSIRSFMDYALAGGTLPWYVICGTIGASTIGGGSLIGFVGSFYEYGAMYFWMVLGSFASCLILIFSYPSELTAYSWLRQHHLSGASPLRRLGTQKGHTSLRQVVARLIHYWHYHLKSIRFSVGYKLSIYRHCTWYHRICCRFL